MIITTKRTPFEYVPLLERKLTAGEQTVFMLKPLELRQKIEIENAMARHTPGTPPVGDVGYLTIRYGIIGWRNLLDENRREVMFERAEDGFVKDQLLNYFKIEQRVELALAITQGAVVTEEEEKNSEEPPSTASQAA